MLKKVCVLLIVFCSLTYSCMAQNSLDLTSDLQNIQSENIKQKISGFLEQNISQKPNIKTPDEFKSITNANATAVYNNISEYVRFIYQNDFTNDEIVIINRILNKGTTIQSIVEVYNFWLTTDEPFGIIEEICALEDKYFSEYWYENVFNSLTDYTHGELSAQDIMDYRQRGITTDQILAANVMCRKDGQNIFDILDNVADGISIEEQAKSLYGAELDSAEANLFGAVMQMAKDSKGKSRENALKKFNIEFNTELLNEVIQTKITSFVNKLGVSVPVTDVFGDYQALLTSGYPISVQRALLNKGYTPQEIKKSAELGGWNFHTSAKNAREMLINEK